MDIRSPIYVDHVQRPQPFVMPQAHHHEKYELYFLADLKGGGLITIEGQEYPLKKDSLIIIDKNLIHRTDFSNALFHERYLLEIDPKLFANQVGQLIHFPVELFFKEYTGVFQLDSLRLTQVGELFARIYDESLVLEPHFEDMVRLKTLEMLLILIRYMEEKEAPSRSEQLATIWPIIKYINDHWCEELSLTQLAEDFYLSKSYLARAFKNCAGLTLHRYLNLLRIKQAQRLLLLYEDLEVQDLARQCGFNSTNYFIRRFREETGLTPTQYRKEYRS